MAFIAICRDADADQSRALREEYRDAHFAYIESILDRLLVAGPAGGTSNAEFSFSVFIYATGDRAAAQRLLADDPYHACGLYGEVTLAPFTPAAGAWIGGTIWQRSPAT